MKLPVTQDLSNFKKVSHKEYGIRVTLNLNDFLHELGCISDETWENHNEYLVHVLWESMDDRRCDRIIRGH